MYKRTVTVHGKAAMFRLLVCLCLWQAVFADLTTLPESLYWRCKYDPDITGASIKSFLSDYGFDGEYPFYREQWEGYPAYTVALASGCSWDVVNVLLDAYIECPVDRSIVWHSTTGEFRSQQLRELLRWSHKAGGGIPLLDWIAGCFRPKIHAYDIIGGVDPLLLKWIAAGRVDLITWSITNVTGVEYAILQGVVQNDDTWDHVRLYNVRVGQIKLGWMVLDVLWWSGNTTTEVDIIIKDWLPPTDYSGPILKTSKDPLSLV